MRRGIAAGPAIAAWGGQQAVVEGFTAVMFAAHTNSSHPEPGSHWLMNLSVGETQAARWARRHTCATRWAGSYWQSHAPAAACIRFRTHPYSVGWRLQASDSVRTQHNVGQRSSGDCALGRLRLEVDNDLLEASSAQHVRQVVLARRA
jgi:hypothetical protein